VGIYEETVTTDALGRRTGPRTRHSIEEKLRVVEETRVRGASVATVARRHNLNVNQVFGWRRLYRRGLLKPPAAGDEAKMLPVKVSTPTVLPTERAAPSVPNPSAPERACEVIKIQLRNGHSIVVRGLIDGEALSRVIDLLIKR
jgi:transposase-like protein